MADFLGQYIRTLSGTPRSITNVLNEARSRQRSIEDVLRLLANRDRFGHLSIPRYTNTEKIISGPLNSAFRDSERALGVIYDDAEDIDFLLESMERGIGSDLKRIEDELFSLEKMLDLFAFFLSDGKKFDGFFIETFSDNVAQNSDLNIQFSDRDDLPLSAEHFVHVDTNAGVAIRGSVNQRKYIPINLADAHINHFPVARYELDLGPASLGVMARVEADALITNKAMPEFLKLGTSDTFVDPNVTLRATDKGLVMKLRYHTSAPTFAQLVQVSPLSNNAVELNQIFLYESESLNGKIPLLDAPKKLTTPQTISFEGRIVTGVEVVLRQTEYKREIFTVQRQVQNTSFNFDEVGRRVIQNYRDGIINLQNPVFRKPESWAKDFAFSRNAESNDVYISRMISGDNATRTSLRPNVSKEIVDLLKGIQGGNKELFKYASQDWSTTKEKIGGNQDIKAREIIKRRIKGVKNKTLTDVFDPNPNTKTDSTPHDFAQENQIVPQTSAAPEFTTVSEQVLKYVYEIGIAGIDLGTGASQSKAVYVSKPIPMGGDPGVVRLSVVDSRSKTLDKLKDSKYLDSIEYSVSNSSYPSSESDWHPILPDNQRLVEAERVFFDRSGRGFFRFNASVDEEVRVYVDGQRLDITATDYLFRTQNGNAYQGIALPQNHFPSDSFVTVDYVPTFGYTEVDFSNDPEFDKVPLSYSSSRQGRGEAIKAVPGHREYQLDNEPYIDKDLVRDAEYTASSGLSYKPITIVFDDGETAINLTNYQKGLQSKLEADAPYYQFLHSGSVITFNKVPTSNFKVIYRFIPSRLRVRAILRCNSPQFTSPSIDLIQVKAKTRHSDVRKI